MRRGQRALHLLAAMLLGGMTLLWSSIALDDVLIALNDRPATATVLEVGPMQRSRSGRVYEVRLSVPLPGAPPIEAWADRALRVTGGWSDPPRRPEPGDNVAVYVSADPPRIVPADRVSSLWGWIGLLAFAWTLVVGFVLVSRRLRRAG